MQKDNLRKDDLPQVMWQPASGTDMQTGQVTACAFSRQQHTGRSAKQQSGSTTPHHVGAWEHLRRDHCSLGLYSPAAKCL